MLPIILFGILFTALTVSVHTAGTLIWIRYKTRRRVRRMGPRPQLTIPQMCSIIGTTASVLLVLHLVEILLWATAYYNLPAITEISSFEDSVYFSMVTFTSLGYGDIVISSKWRLLSGIQAMAGMLVLGWSSALLFAVLVDLGRLNNGAASDDEVDIQKSQSPDPSADSK